MLDECVSGQQSEYQQFDRSPFNAERVRNEEMSQ